jgi:hypothetical protein
MKINDRDFDEFGLPLEATRKTHRPKRKGRRKEERFDDWGHQGSKKKDKPWRGKVNR